MEKRKVVDAPPETSKNKSLREGCLHCLLYGFNPNQVDGARATGQYVRNGRLRHRIVLPKVPGDRQRSRSRSNSPVSDIDEDVRLRNDQNQLEDDPPYDIDEFLQNADNYEIARSKLYRYFEPHKADFLVIQEENNYATVLCAVEVTSYQRFHATFRTTVKQATHQCVQKCLAGISSNQAKINGLIFVPDGLKLIQVQRGQLEVQQGPNQNYSVKETDLITWDETNKIFQILYYLQNSFFD